MGKETMNHTTQRIHTEKRKRIEIFANRWLSRKFYVKNQYLSDHGGCVQLEFFFFLWWEKKILFGSNRLKRPSENRPELTTARDSDDQYVTDKRPDKGREEEKTISPVHETDQPTSMEMPIHWAGMIRHLSLWSGRNPFRYVRPKAVFLFQKKRRKIRCYVPSSTPLFLSLEERNFDRISPGDFFPCRYGKGPFGLSLKTIWRSSKGERTTRPHAHTRYGHQITLLPCIFFKGLKWIFCLREDAQLLIYGHMHSPYVLWPFPMLFFSLSTHICWPWKRNFFQPGLQC